jgi:hypothetical protein
MEQNVGSSPLMLDRADGGPAKSQFGCYAEAVGVSESLRERQQETYILDVSCGKICGRIREFLWQKGTLPNQMEQTSASLK